MNDSEDDHERLKAPPSIPEGKASEAHVGQSSASMPAGSHAPEKKREANRENSKHSTGPKEGKFWSRLNALKHGCYATDVVIVQGDGKEDREQYFALHEGLRRALKPTDMMQEQLVTEITNSLWRQRRAERAEIGKISRQTNSFAARHYLDAFREGRLMDSSFSIEKGNEDGANRRFSWSNKGVKHDICKARTCLEHGIILLAQVRKSVEETGSVYEELQKKLDTGFGTDNALAKGCYELSELVLLQQAEEGKSTSEREQSAQLADCEMIEQKKQYLLELIDLSITHLQKLHVDLEQAEALEQQAIVRTHNLPSKEFIEKLIRYETMLERRQSNAVKLLLLLQGKTK